MIPHFRKGYNLQICKADRLHQRDTTHTKNWHFGIAGHWTWTLDPEMLDSGPIFPEILKQNSKRNTFRLRGMEDVSPSVCFTMINFKSVIISRYMPLGYHYNLVNEN